jgi:hypothetical protein
LVSVKTSDPVESTSVATKRSAPRITETTATIESTATAVPSTVRKDRSRFAQSV